MLVYCVGTMKIDHPDTPFLFLDADDPCGEVAAIHPKYLSTHLPMAERTGAPLARCGGNSKALFGRPACLSHQASCGRGWSTLGAALGILWRWPCLLVYARRSPAAESWWAVQTLNSGRSAFHILRCARASPDASAGPTGRLGAGHDGRGWAGELHPPKVGARRGVWSAAAG
jgi:hypothetical protein